jgi:hypothetical protein
MACSPAPLSNRACKAGRKLQVPCLSMVKASSKACTPLLLTRHMKYHNITHVYKPTTLSTSGLDSIISHLPASSTLWRHSRSSRKDLRLLSGIHKRYPSHRSRRLPCFVLLPRLIIQPASTTLHCSYWTYGIRVIFSPVTARITIKTSTPKNQPKNTPNTSIILHFTIPGRRPPPNRLSFQRYADRHIKYPRELPANLSYHAGENNNNGTRAGAIQHSER